MTRFATSDSKWETQLQEVENFMREKGIYITSYGGNGFTVQFEGEKAEFWLQVRGSGERVTSFPRMTEEEGLALRE